MLAPLTARQGSGQHLPEHLLLPSRPFRADADGLALPGGGGGEKTVSLICSRWNKRRNCSERARSDPSGTRDSWRCAENRKAACSRQQRASGVVAGTARGSHSRAFATKGLWPTTRPQGRMAVKGSTDSASCLVSPNARARRSRMASRGASGRTASMAVSASSSPPSTGSSNERSSSPACSSWPPRHGAGPRPAPWIRVWRHAAPAHPGGAGPPPGRAAPPSPGKSAPAWDWPPNCGSRNTGETGAARRRRCRHRRRAAAGRPPCAGSARARGCLAQGERRTGRKAPAPAHGRRASRHRRRSAPGCFLSSPPPAAPGHGCHLRLVNQVGDQLLYGGTGSGMGQIAQQLQHLHCAWRLAHGHGLAGFAGHDLGNVLRLYGAQDLQDLQQLAAGERGCAACPVARKGSAAPAQAFQRQIEFPG